MKSISSLVFMGYVFENDVTLFTKQLLTLLPPCTGLDDSARVCSCLREAEALAPTVGYSMTT